MVTYESRVVATGKDEFDVRCLSTDTKPTGTHDGREIANGSTLMEIDTGKVYMYDEDGDTWDEI